MQMRKVGFWYATLRNLVHMYQNTGDKSQNNRSEKPKLDVKNFIPGSKCQGMKNYSKRTWRQRSTNYRCRKWTKVRVLSLHRALWNLYIVHPPTNALLLNLEKFKIYIKININIAPTCFGLRLTSGNLYKAWLKLYLC